MLQHLQGIFGGKIVKDEHKTKPLWSTGYKLQLAFYEDWLLQVIPYLVGKKQKAILFMEVRKLLNQRNLKGKSERIKRIIEINNLLRKKEWLI